MTATLWSAKYEGPAGTSARQQYHASVSQDKDGTINLQIGALTLSHTVPTIEHYDYSAQGWSNRPLAHHVKLVKAAAKRRGLSLVMVGFTAPKTQR